MIAFLRQIMTASGRSATTGTALEPPCSFWKTPLVAARKCGKSMPKRLKAWATFIMQWITSVLVISVLVNAIMVPSLETAVVPACEKLTIAGTAGMAGTYWVQCCSARGRSARLRKKKTQAVRLCTSNFEVYSASLVKLEKIYRDAARKHGKPVRCFANLMPGTRKQGVREQFPHSEESFAGVRAALAKAENDLDKCYVAWQAADNTVTVLEADIVAADAAADVAEAKRKSYSQAKTTMQPRNPV
ncbi:hypothetical protein WJX79_005632 [Trebouxia sp. C0005]